MHMGEISCCHSQGRAIEDDLGSFGIYVRSYGFGKQ